MSPISSRGAGVASLIALLGGALGCVGPDPGEQLIGGPPFGNQGADFAPVSTVLERRCGTLDCHGSVYRPLRIYGQFGLRRYEEKGSMALNGQPFDQYYTGGSVATTTAELLDNFNSVIGLEPELTLYVALKLPKDNAQVRLPCPTAPTDDMDTLTIMTPDCLSLIRKPRLQEKHKGGAIWGRGDEGDKCIAGWLQRGTKGDGSYKLDCDKELLENR